jgi:hypothetical protein
VTVTRMDNVGIVVEGLDAIEFFMELGPDREGRRRSGGVRGTRIGSATSAAPKAFSSGWPLRRLRVLRVRVSVFTP